MSGRKLKSDPESHFTFSRSTAIATTFTGIGAIAAFAPPAMLPISLLGLGAVWIYRLLNEEPPENRPPKEETMSSLLPMRYSGIPSFLDMPYVPTRVDPLAELARQAPSLAHEVMLKHSQDKMIEGLANSSVATEFAKQGRGVRMGVRRYRTLFSEVTESYILPD